MQANTNHYCLGLLVVTLASITGCCADLQHVPDQCADALYECDLGCLVHNLCTAGEPFPCAAPVDCGQIIEEPCAKVPCAEEACADQPCNTQVCTEEVISEACGPICPLDCTSLRDCAPLRNCIQSCRDKVAVGPPPVPYRPAMPPKFLALPTRPVYTAVSPHAPSPDRCQVEVDYGPQLAFPGRD